MKVQRLTEIFRNPFYCGVLSNALLNYEPIRGKHESLVSEQTFIKINRLLKDNSQGYSHKKMDMDLPLQKFIECDVCGTMWSGYIVKSKGIHYYKCNRIGCKCNKNAEKMHDLFAVYLTKHAAESKNIEPLKLQLKLTYEAINKLNAENQKILKARLRETDEKLSKVEERFALDEISKETFEKVGTKFKDEKKEIENQLQPTEIYISNFEKYFDHTLKMSQKLSDLWDSSGYSLKQNLQYLMFPEGIQYNKQNNVYRTRKTNYIFSLIADESMSLGNKKSGLATDIFAKSALVARRDTQPRF